MSELVPLATTAAVVAELFHLVGDHSHNIQTAWRLLRSAAVTVLPVADADLAAVERLMDRYADRLSHPMEFADTTLVHLAATHSLTTVLTIDHADFEICRIPGGRSFRVVPNRL